MTDVMTAPADQHQTPTALIAAQNDLFRTSILNAPADPREIKGRMLITPGVVAEGEAFMQQALQLTAGYDAFSEDADPYGLHEMGVIEVQSRTVWWRIDLYDCDYRFGAETPSDPNQTRRVLTILLPSEY